MCGHKYQHAEMGAQGDSKPGPETDVLTPKALGGTMTEQWKDIEGYEGIYQVSDQGRVRSLDRVGVARQRLKGKVLKPGTNRNGYCYVILCKKLTVKHHAVHRLVALAFLGPDRERQVNHKSGKKTDNQALNLEWVTAKENMRHSMEVLGNSSGRKGEAHSQVKLTANQVREIRRLYASKDHSQYNLAKLFGVHRSTIEHIVTRRTWKHVG